MPRGHVFILALSPLRNDPADRRIMQPQAIGDFDLTVAVLCHRFDDPFISRRFSANGRKELLKRRPIYESLPPRYFFNQLFSEYERAQTLRKSIGSKQTLSFHTIPNRTGSDSALDKFAVLRLCTVLPLAEMAENLACSQARVRRRQSRRCPIAAPFPMPRMRNCFGPRWIKYHIPTDFQKMAVLLKENGFESPLENRADMRVSAIECLSVDAVDLSHAPGQIGVRCFDHQMVMVVHQAVSVSDPMEAVDDGRQDIQKQRTVAIITKNPLAVIAARGHVIQRTIVFQS
jgi:hypothetical protein